MSQKLSPSDINEIFEIDVANKETIENENSQKAPKKINEENLKILQKFDNYDTEHNKELDVYQLKKYIEKEFNINLSEESIKYHCGQTFLEKAYKVQRNEFIAFHKYICSNLNEIIKEKTVCFFDEFENQFGEKGGVDFQCKYLDRNAFVINASEKPHVLKYNLERPKISHDSYHSKIYNQLFEVTHSIYRVPNQYRSIFDGKPPLKTNNVAQGNEEAFSVDSLVQTEVRKPGTRKRKSKYLFEYYNPKLTEEDLLYSNNLTNAKSQPLESDVKIKKPSLIEITGFKTNLTVDNLFCRMSLYDKDFVKLTSYFYFTITAERLKEHMETSKPLDLPIASAVLKKDYIANNCTIFVVLEVYKQMDGDINFARDLYSDENKREMKMMKKYMDRIKECSKTFEQKKFLQLLMFSAKSINFQASHTNIKLVKPVGDVKDIATMIKDVDKMKSCGEWSFKYRGTRPEIVHIDGPYRMFSSEKSDAALINIHMLTDTCSHETEEIFMDYENLLFVYPTEVSLGKEKKKSGVAITVYFRNNDSQFDETKPNALQAIFPSQGTPVENFDISYTTTVSIDKVGHFLDEVKIQLPFPLTEKYHLLFVIKEVNVEDGCEGKHYYGKLPLYENGNIIGGGEHVIQLMKDMVPNYLQHAECYDISKIYIKASIQLVSTVYPQEPIVAQFISGKVPIGDIKSVDNHFDLVHFLPCILQRCIEVLIDNKKEEIFDMFKVFRIIDMARDTKPEEESESFYIVYKNPMVLNAINHFVQTKTSDGHCICTIILTALPIIFEKTEKVVKERLKYVWIMFNMIIKSVVGYYETNKVFDLTNFHDYCLSGNGQRFGATLFERVKSFSDFIAYCAENKIVDSLIIRDANIFYAEFIRDLAILWKRDEIAKIVDNHLDTLCMMKDNGGSMVANFQHLLRLEFVSVLAESDRLYQINGPQLLEIKEINKLNDQLQQRHALMFIILRQYFQLILSPDKAISKMALQELLIIMNKYDLDKQFSTQSERDKFFNMVFPLVLFMLDDSEKINEWKAKDSLSDLYDIETLYVIFFFILKNLRESTIQQWLVTDFLPSLLNSLLSHMRKALLLFSRYPYSFIPNAAAIYSKELVQLIKEIENKNPVKVVRSPSPSLMRSSSSIVHSRISALGSSSHRFSSKLKRTNDSYEQESTSTPRKAEKEHGTSGSETPKKTTVYSDRTSALARSKNSGVILTKDIQQEDGIDNLITDIALIAMDFVETTIAVLVNAEHTKALDRAQEIISSVLFEVKPTDNYLPSLYEFIRSMITTYRDFIFKRPNTLALNLLKNLLRLSNSENQIQKNFSNNLIFIFAKTNFIVTGNTVATIVNATSALSELQMTDVHNMEASIQGLVDLAKRYHDNFDSKLQKCIELSLNEGIRRNKSLQRAHQLYQAMDAGDLDVFITFVSDYLDVLNNLLDFILNAEPTVTNDYVAMKREIVKMLKNNENCKMIKEWIEFVEKKIKSIGGSYISFLQEKAEQIISKYGICTQRIDQLEGHCDEDEKVMKDLEEKCKSNKIIGEKILDWAKKSLSIDSCDLESFDDVQLIRKIEDLEKEQSKRTNEIKELLDGYTSFDSTLTNHKLSSNPLFPVTSQEMTDGVRKVLQLHQSRIKAVNSHLQTRTSYDSEKERYINKVRSFENIMDKKFIDICSEVCGMPIDSNFLKESLDKFKVLGHLYNNNVSKLDNKKEKMGGLKPSWEIAYCSWEESIGHATSVVEWLLQLIQNVKNNEENIQEMKKWYDGQRQFVKTIISLYLWDGLYVSLVKVTMRESNDYLRILSKVSQYLIENVKEAKKQYDDAGNLLQELRKKKKLPLGFKYLQLVPEKHFESVLMTAELYDAKWKEEEKIEKIRKDYAALFEEFFNETDKIMSMEQSKVPATVIQKIQNLRDKLLVYDEQKIDKLNRYCDLQRSEQTVWGRCSALGIPERTEKENTTLKSPVFTYSQKSLSSSSLSVQNIPRIARRGEETRDIIGFFIDSEERVKIDCFHDLSYGQRDSFDDDLKIVQDDIISILKNLNELNLLLNHSRDPQFLLERYYEFAMNYVSAPQLHMTWISKLAQKHRGKQQYNEAGLCEVHLILFIHHLLPQESVSIDVETLKTNFGYFVPNTSVAPNPQFTSHLTEDMILHHITSACSDFENGKMPWYGLMVASIVIPYYIKKSKFKELGQTHDFVNRMYLMMVERNSDGVIKDFVQFYYVRLFGSVFGDYLNNKSFIYSSTKERMSYLLKETNDILPPSYKGEKHFLRSLDQVNERVIRSENECNILWTQVQPVYDKGDFIQYSSTFNCDELFIPREEIENESMTIQNAQILSLYKKRTIIKTGFVLPSLLTRRTVESEEEVYLNPIDIMIEEMEKRKKNIEYFLSETKKFFDEIEFGVLSSLQKSLMDFFFGTSDVQVGKSNAFNTIKANEVLEIFYSDLDRFELNSYFKLCEIMKETMNCCSEGLAIIKGNSKTRKNSVNLEKIERQQPRVNRFLDDIEKLLEAKKEEILL